MFVDSHLNHPQVGRSIFKVQGTSAIEKVSQFSGALSMLFTAPAALGMFCRVVGIHYVLAISGHNSPLQESSYLCNFQRILATKLCPDGLDPPSPDTGPLLITAWLTPDLTKVQLDLLCRNTHHS